MLNTGIKVHPVDLKPIPKIVEEKARQAMYVRALDLTGKH